MKDIVFKPIDINSTTDKDYSRKSVGCLILSWDGMLILQLRDEFAPVCPNMIATFGGGIETNESPGEALVRELHEELGAIVIPSDVINIGTIEVRHSEENILVFMYFWHDKHNTITGCYEGKARYVNDPVFLENEHQVSNSVNWAVRICREKKLIP